MARSIALTRTREIMTALVLSALIAMGATTSARAADADTIAPTAPGNFHLVSRTKGGSITLGWDASSDNVGVAGYRLYRDGTSKGTLYQAGVDLIGTVWYDKLDGRVKGPVTYELYAFDAAGNVSAAATLVVTK